jgi:hypothetical protein
LAPSAAVESITDPIGRKEIDVANHFQQLGSLNG